MVSGHSTPDDTLSRWYSVTSAVPPVNRSLSSGKNVAIGTSTLAMHLRSMGMPIRAERNNLTADWRSCSEQLVLRPHPHDAVQRPIYSVDPFGDAFRLFAGCPMMPYFLSFRYSVAEPI